MTSPLFEAAARQDALCSLKWATWHVRPQYAAPLHLPYNISCVEASSQLAHRASAALLPLPTAASNSSALFLANLNIRCSLKLTYAIAYTFEPF